MKFVLFILFLLNVSIFANPIFKDKGAKYSLNLEVGQRTDNIDWNINQVNDNPNILSELTWSDVESYYGKIELYGVEGAYRLKINYSRSFEAYAGENQDSDYNLDDRQGEYSRSNNKTNGSYFEDYSISIGENYNLDKSSNVVFWLGYEVNNQFLRINEGTQTIGSADLTGLDSSYDSTWKGFNAGLEYELSYSSFEINTNIFYHWLNYKAKANWNLRTDFEHPVSFEHEIGDATGISYGIDVKYKWNKDITLFSTFDYLKYEGQNGSNTQYTTSGIKGDAINEANWESSKISFGINIRF